MNQKKKFAIPTAGDVLTPHFGHCEKFAIVETMDDEVLSIDFVEPPAHQPGVYPGFLASQKVDIIIAGGMGMKAQDLFAQHNIAVCIGVESGSPDELVRSYLRNELTVGQNLCDH